LLWAFFFFAYLFFPDSFPFLRSIFLLDDPVVHQSFIEINTFYLVIVVFFLDDTSA
jgi:hypothetical protein